MGTESCPRDPEKAIAYFHQAVDKGDVVYQRQLAEYLHHGTFGIPQDHRQALRYFELAAAQEDGWSYRRLGEYYAVGLGGCVKNIDHARALYGKAAELGDNEAVRHLQALEQSSELPAPTPSQQHQQQQQFLGSRDVQNFAQEFEFLDSLAVSPFERELIDGPFRDISAASAASASGLPGGPGGALCGPFSAADMHNDAEEKAPCDSEKEFKTYKNNGSQSNADSSEASSSSSSSSIADSDFFGTSPAPMKPSALFKKGLEFERMGPAHEAAAVPLYLAAAEMEFAAALARVAAYYENGRGGLPRDPQTAYLFYKRAAAKGELGSQAKVAAAERRDPLNPGLALKDPFSPSKAAKVTSTSAKKTKFVEQQKRQGPSQQKGQREPSNLDGVEGKVTVWKVSSAASSAAAKGPAPSRINNVKPTVSTTTTTITAAIPTAAAAEDTPWLASAVRGSAVPDADAAQPSTLHDAAAVFAGDARNLKTKASGDDYEAPTDVDDDDAEEEDDDIETYADTCWPDDMPALVSLLQVDNGINDNTGGSKNTKGKPTKPATPTPGTAKPSTVPKKKTSTVTGKTSAVTGKASTVAGEGCASWGNKSHGPKAAPSTTTPSSSTDANPAKTVKNPAGAGTSKIPSESASSSSTTTTSTTSSTSTDSRPSDVPKHSNLNSAANVSRIMSVLVDDPLLTHKPTFSAFLDGDPVDPASLGPELAGLSSLELWKRADAYRLSTQGTSHDTAQQALRMYRVMLDKGPTPHVVTQLAGYFMSGLAGLPQDQVTAVRLYRRGAEMGSALSLAQLGISYEQGRGGLQPNMKIAVRYLKAAAALHEPSAISRLKRLQDEGTAERERRLTEGPPLPQTQSSHQHAVSTTATAVQSSSRMFASTPSAAGPYAASSWKHGAAGGTPGGTPGGAAAATGAAVLPPQASERGNAMSSQSSTKASLTSLATSALPAKSHPTVPALSAFSFSSSSSSSSSSSPAMPNSSPLNPAAMTTKSLLDASNGVAPRNPVARPKLPMRPPIAASSIAVPTPAPSESVPAAMWRLGEAHLGGRPGYLKDESKALEYYVTAAEGGHSGACARIADMYFAGSGGCAKDEGIAVQWLEKAAERGHVQSLSHLARTYELGLYGRGKDERLALELYTRASDAWEPEALTALGRFHQQGKAGLPAKEHKALECFLAAAAQGHAEAMFELGRLADPSVLSDSSARTSGGVGAGTGLDQLNLNVLASLPSSSTSSCSSLSSSCSTSSSSFSTSSSGSSTRPSHGLRFPRGAERAAEWYQRAAAAGHAASQVRVGEMYEHGLWGLAKDESMALSLYTKAAQQGNAEALVRLGQCHMSGKCGLEQDSKMAMRLFGEAEQARVALLTPRRDVT